MRYQLLLFLVVVSAVAAQSYPFDASLYDAATIRVEVDTSSSVALTGPGRAEKLEATVYYVPEESEKIIASPDPTTINPLVFTWVDVTQGTYKYSYSTQVTNSVQKPLITKQILYPFNSPAEIAQYLQPQEITDTNSNIRQKANELVAGKTDAMDAVFSIAQWVQQNVKYDLTSVTAQASQKSSWVYVNRYGVCDEITSIFMSLAREAGIPARFVSGIAYTNLESFPDHWGPHGWAEVWLPDKGWIPVDVTYGQIGYVDATHIAIRHSLDSKTTAVDYSLLSTGMTMQSGEVKTEATVLDKSGSIEEPLDKEVSALYTNVGSSSGDLITATITNNQRYYTSTDVYLMTTSDTTVIDKRSQSILLPPESTRKLSWRVKLPDFQRGYEYTIPFTIILQNSGNASGEIIGNAKYKSYPVPPSQATAVSSITITCSAPQDMYVGETTTVTCISPGAKICTDTCSTDTKTLSFTAISAGAFPIVVTASSSKGTGSAVVTYVVTNRPNPSITVTLPPDIKFDEAAALTIQVQTSQLSDSTVTIQAKYFSHSWNSSVLDNKQYELRFPGSYLDAGNNTIAVIVAGKDKNGNVVTKVATASITLEANFLEKIELFLMHLLS